jgi:large subunit ribosomal protein L29
MKTAEVKELTTKELIERIETEKAYIVRQKLNHAISPLDNPLSLRTARRNIARLMTELNRRKNEEKIKSN